MDSENANSCTGSFQAAPNTDTPSSELPKDHPVKVIRKLREEIVGLLEIKNKMNTREISLCVTKLEEARMWMGKLLGKLGEAYPYPESMNPNSRAIEAPTDIPEAIKGLFLSDNVANLKTFRAETSQVLSSFNVIMQDVLSADNAIICISIQQRLTEANIWAGMALGTLRDK